MGEKPPTGFRLFQGERRFNYRQVVDFQVTYFPHGFPCFSSLTQSFDIYKPERKKSRTMSPKKKGTRALPSLAGGGEEQKAVRCCTDKEAEGAGEKGHGKMVAEWDPAQ